MLNTNTTTFDGLSRPLTNSRNWVDATGAVTDLTTATTAYYGTITETTPPLSGKTRTDTDSLGRTTRSEHFNNSNTTIGATTNLTYAWTATGTNAGFLTTTSQHSASGTPTLTTTTVTDLAGQAISQTTPDSGTTTLTYDAGAAPSPPTTPTPPPTPSSAPPTTSSTDPPTVTPTRRPHHHRARCCGRFR